MNHLGDYDVIVIGAGHAGIEAAHAAATLGARTAVFTMSLDAIGNMPCNPSIGGTAKGTLVRELDALGGVMGLAADATYLQSRMLNKGKGPAVHALRVQTDRKRYHEYMKHALELTPGLAIHQAEVVSIETENGRVKGVVTQLNGEYSAKCVVIATGTNLGGKIFVGDAWYASGPDGMHAANALTDSLKAAGLPLRRFKTGTPARVHRRSIDFSKLECQPGDPDNELQPFSFMTDAPMHNKVECWIAYTNPETHRIILDNIQRSPLYGGMIEGVGPRYCPSIEDKVVRFAGKDRHPIFVEPCGENTEEMYLQGASSSLPEDVQNAFYRSIKGFENIEIMRPAYAIEYDCVDPTSLEATLESKVVRGLYGAGQFNGTSGYEEAAAQGLLAGLNAARNALGKEQLILPRHTSYLGTLVDDLVSPSVVVITTEQVVYSQWSWYGQNQVESGAGSGVIISSDGYILTCAHVVDGASTITVTIGDKDYTATLVGEDTTSDIAVIKIDADGLTPATVGNSDSLKVGQSVMAVGNPLGELGGTVTGGMISALNRSVTIQGSSSVNTMSLIQMDASVSPGNSGGGLFNMNGELVGIVNAKSSSSDAEGLGFAIPINDAIKVAQELLENGYVTGRPYLGITYLAVEDAQTAAQLGVNAYGVYVVEVVKGGPAEKAGLQAGDRIVSVDGTEIASKDDLGTLMQKHAAGDTLSITIAREGQMQTVNVTLGEKTASNS